MYVADFSLVVASVEKTMWYLSVTNDYMYTHILFRHKATHLCTFPTLIWFSLFLVDTAIATKETNLEFVLSITKLYILMIHTVKCSNNTKCCCKHWKSLEPSSRTRIGKFIRHLSTCKKQKCSVKHCSLMKFFFHHRNACHCSSCKFCNQFVNCLTFHSNTSEKSAQP